MVRNNMIMKFMSQEERKEYGGTCFIELQLCMLPKGTSINRLLRSHDFWRDDSLYVHGDSPFYSTYKDIDSGKVVEGWEPEFEETTDVAESFDEFIEKIISGDIVLVV